MKKTSFLMASLLMTTGSMFAQNEAVEVSGGELVSLLPEGVTINIESSTQGYKQKNLVVAGSKDKGYKAFFAASDETCGEELWVTDGTPGGTKRVKDIFEGPTGSNPSNLARFNDKVVFAADDGNSGIEAWISDGTEEGTYMLGEIHEFGSANPRGFTQLNETQFVFGAMNLDSQSDGEQYWLYISDGTPAGTTLLSDECATEFPGTYASSGTSTPWLRVGRKVFFKADSYDKKYGIELWVTDGTKEGTRLVKDINIEEGKIVNGAVDHFVNFYNEKLFFLATSFDAGPEPWATDGTEANTYMIVDSNPTVDAETGKGVGGGVSAPGDFPYKGKIWFRGYGPEVGSELACTDLTEGNFAIFDLNKNVPSASNNGDIQSIIPFDDMLVFNANTGKTEGVEGNFGAENHYTDGETIYFPESWDLLPGHHSYFAVTPVVVAGSLYWRANPSGSAADLEEYKTRLYRLDGINDTPEQVMLNFDPAAGDLVHNLRNLDGKLLFASSNENGGLYAYTYRKADYDEEKDADNLEIEFRTREEIEKETGIAMHEDSQAEILLYPNPATDKFSFSVSGKALSIKIFDTLGRLVKEETELVTGNMVDVSTLINGVYKVVITSNEGTVASSLVINK